MRNRDRLCSLHTAMGHRQLYSMHDPALYFSEEAKRDECYDMVATRAAHVLAQTMLCDGSGEARYDFNA